MFMSSACFTVILPSGNPAVYLVQPQHLPRDDIPQSKDWPSTYGQQLAVRVGGDWVSSKDQRVITDLKTISLLERCPAV